MSATETRQAIESILMVADSPVEPSVLAQLLEVPKADVEAMCDALAADYEAAGHGFILARVAGGYRFQSHPDLAPYVERFVLDGQTSRLSSAALETLAIVAYKQPISRMQIAAIRGVNVDGVLRTLQQRGYVDEISRDSGPGNAVLFGTTDLFLERVGLDSTADLPPLAEFVPGADVVEALEDGLRPDPVEAPSSQQTTEAEASHPDGEVEPVGADAHEPVDVEGVVAGESGDVEPVEVEGVVAGESGDVEPVDVEGVVGGESADVAGESADVDVDVVSVEVTGTGAGSTVPSPVDLDAEGIVDGGARVGEVVATDETDALVGDAVAVTDQGDDGAAEVAMAGEVAATGQADVGPVDEVIDLVAAEFPADRDGDVVVERPTELEEELAAIDALAADIAEADAGERPTWSPAESSAVTTVRHDDPPEAEPAAPFRPAPGGLGGAGTEAGPGGQDLASGEDLGAGEASPLTGPDARDD